MAYHPVITEDYQRKLDTFLADLPLSGTEIPSGTPATPTPVDKATLDANKKTYQTNELFRKYTGWEHWDLVNKWRSDRTTTCNEFCQKCALAMGYTGSLGRFDIADWLASRGLSHAWVPADSGATPEFGDIFRLLGSEPDDNGVRLNHMAVSLQIDGGDWYTAEGGQAGPIKGYDAVRRRTRAWKHPALRGWVSMKALLGAEQPLPFWLGGWWQVEEEPYDTYYYYFAANGKVSCSTTKPGAPIIAPLTDQLVGSFTSKRMFEVQISWNSADVDETLICQADPGNRKYLLSGKTKLGANLSGKRLMLASAFG